MLDFSMAFIVKAIPLETVIHSRVSHTKYIGCLGKPDIKSPWSAVATPQVSRFSPMSLVFCTSSEGRLFLASRVGHGPKWIVILLRLSKKDITKKVSITCMVAPVRGTLDSSAISLECRCCVKMVLWGTRIFMGMKCLEQRNGNND